MFGGVEGDELDFGGFEEDVDGGVQLAVDAGGVGDQADALAFQAGEMAVAEDFDAGFDAGPGGGRRGGCGGVVGGGGGAGYEEQRRRAKKVTVMVARQHIMTTIKNPT